MLKFDFIIRGNIELKLSFFAQTFDESESEKTTSSINFKTTVKYFSHSYVPESQRRLDY